MDLPVAIETLRLVNVRPWKLQNKKRVAAIMSTATTRGYLASRYPDL